MVTSNRLFCDQLQMFITSTRVNIFRQFSVWRVHNGLHTLISKKEQMLCGSRNFESKLTLSDYMYFFRPLFHVIRIRWQKFGSTFVINMINSVKEHIGTGESLIFHTILRLKSVERLTKCERFRKWVKKSSGRKLWKIKTAFVFEFSSTSLKWKLTFVQPPRTCFFLYFTGVRFRIGSFPRCQDDFTAVVFDAPLGAAITSRWMRIQNFRLQIMKIWSSDWAPASTFLAIFRGKVPW